MFVALLLLGAGLSDLVRGTPDRADLKRCLLAACVGSASSAAIAALGGFSATGTAIIAAALAVVLVAWALVPGHATSLRARVVLIVVGVFLVALLSASGGAPSAAGDLLSWYQHLPFRGTHKPPFSRFLLGLSAGIFVLSSANRLVRLVLEAAAADLETGEEALKGGRWLGALERLLVLGVVLAGQPTGAAVVIAAKGLIRIPEVARRGPDHDANQSREVTEYFLIGTLSSLLIATALAALILAMN